MNNKKKVLHVVESFGGGVFTFLSDLLNEMSDEYEIVVAYSMRKQTPENFKEYFNLSDWRQKIFFFIEKYLECFFIIHLGHVTDVSVARL